MPQGSGDHALLRCGFLPDVGVPDKTFLFKFISVGVPTGRMSASVSKACQQRKKSTDHFHNKANVWFVKCQIIIKNGHKNVQELEVTS